jgi:hypothetical protein
MDFYTIFALTMVVTGTLALLVGIGYMQVANSEIKLSREFMQSYAQRSLDLIEAHGKLRAQVEKALANDIRNIQTRLHHHTSRLNELDDLTDLLNTDSAAHAELINNASRDGDNIETGNGQVDRSLRSLGTLREIDDGVLEIQDMNEADKWQ